MKKLLLLLTLLVTAICLRAQETLLLQYTSSITSEELRQHVFTLSADSMEGRYTGSGGAEKAAAYLKSEFRQMGLLRNPETAGFGQPYELEKCWWEQLAIRQGDSKYSYPDDFVILDHPLSREETFEAVFAGYGLDTENYSDLDDIDLRGKVVVAYSGEPKDQEGRYLISGGEERSRQAYYFNKFLAAKDRGAKGFILISDKNRSFRKFSRQARDQMQRHRLTSPEDRDTSGFFGFFTGEETAASLLGTKKKRLRKMMEEGRAYGALTGTRFSVEGDRRCVPVMTENVVGWIEGTDLRDEWVVVVAHYDHLGMKNDKIYHGADDNASGVAGVLEVAEAFALATGDGIRPRRSVVFLLVSGEEEGLLGSRFYSEHPIHSLDHAVAALNLDMIGRVRDKEKEKNYIGGWAYLSTGLLETAERNTRLVAPSLDFRMRYSERRGGGSDHYYFMKNGIPSIFYFTGVHKDYHQPGDTPEKLLYGRMELIVRSVFATAWDLANTPEPPGVN